MLMPLHAGYLIVLIEVCCRGPSLLHVLEDQLQTSHYNNVLFSMEQLAYNMGWIILKATLIVVLKMHFQHSKLPGTSHPENE